MRKFFILTFLIILTALAGRALWAWQQTKLTQEQIKTAEQVVQPKDVRATVTSTGTSTTVIIGGQNVQ